MALVYVVKKPHVSGKIVRWLLLFLKYDFIIMHNLGKIHVVTNALLKLPYIIKPTSVLDQTTNASMFYIELEWLNDVKEVLRM